MAFASMTALLSHRQDRPLRPSFNLPFTPFARILQEANHHGCRYS
jgi:hypothetical protein